MSGSRVTVCYQMQRRAVSHTLVPSDRGTVVIPQRKLWWASTVSGCTVRPGGNTLPQNYSTVSGMGLNYCVQGIAVAIYFCLPFDIVLKTIPWYFCFEEKCLPLFTFWLKCFYWLAKWTMLKMFLAGFFAHLIAHVL